MERKAVRIVMCIAAILTAVITLWGKETERTLVPQTIAVEQVMRECSGLIISQTERDMIDQVRVDQLDYPAYERRELDHKTCEVLGAPGGDAFAQIAPGPDGPASDLLYIICWMNGGGRIVYEVSNEFYNKTVEPSGRNVLYLNQNNTTYEKYTSQVLWPWSDF